MTTTASKATQSRALCSVSGLDVCDHARKIERELREAQDALREMIGILEENIARRAGMVTPGGGNMHEAMLLAKWRMAAGLDTANSGTEMTSVDGGICK
jgi:hypothetical protein